MPQLRAKAKESKGPQVEGRVDLGFKPPAQGGRYLIDPNAPEDGPVFLQGTDMEQTRDEKAKTDRILGVQAKTGPRRSAAPEKDTAGE